jgi:hypothetical protein
MSAVAAPEQLPLEPPQPAHLEPQIASVQHQPAYSQHQHVLPQLRVETFLPWMLSLAVNLSLLVILAVLTASGLLDKIVHVEIAAAFNSEPEVTPVDLPEIGSGAEGSSDQPFLSQSTDDETPDVSSPEELNAEMLRPSPTLVDPNGLTTASQELAAATESQSSNSLPRSKDLFTLVPTTTARGPVTEKQLKERHTLQEVALDVGEEIRAKLAEDSLLVVWLLDASLSLVDNRQELAAHLDGFWSSLDQQLAEPVKGKKKRLLMNSVVAFGNGAQGISAPHRLPAKATFAMRNMPVDPSGVETTCQAVIWTALSARENWEQHRGQVMIVLFTDESGDDMPLLEEAIEVCRQNKVTVSVIGPAGILGTDEGFHRWKHPRVPTPFWLPVAKGPDSAIPERLRVPYWWSAERLGAGWNLPANARDLPQELMQAAPWQAKLPAWAEGAEIDPSDYFSGSYAGRELLNLNSGFPPFGLMRLTRETNGTYTMFDRAGDRGPFRLKLMRRYTPDYRSQAELLDELRYHPLRAAIVNAAMLTRKYAPQTPPSTRFWIGHVEPERFRNYCIKTMPQCDAQAAETSALLEQALLGFGAGGMELEYGSESSDRWRAWYDLNVGRLLLQSVRFAEYRATLRLIDHPALFPNQANQITLFPFATIRSGDLALRRAVEGERLLKRCLAQNPGTPWAFLAARELEHPLGLDFEWRYIPPPPPPPPSGPRMYSPPAEPIVLPKL